MDYPEHVAKRDRLLAALADPERLVEQMVAEAVGPAGKQPAKPEAVAKARHKAERKVREMQDELAVVEAQVVDLESDPSAMHYLAHHRDIAAAALAETAKLHAGDPENLRLWKEFLPACRDEIDRMYRRLDVKFDHTLGESFYHDRLAGVVDDLIGKGIARESEGAICVFLPGSRSAADRAQTGRRVSVCHDRPGHDPVSHGRVAARRDSVCGRSSPKPALRAIVRHGPAVGL